MEVTEERLTERLKRELLNAQRQGEAYLKIIKDNGLEEKYRVFQKQRTEGAKAKQSILKPHRRMQR